MCIVCLVEVCDLLTASGLCVLGIYGQWAGVPPRSARVR